MRSAQSSVARAVVGRCVLDSADPAVLHPLAYVAVHVAQAPGAAVDLHDRRWQLVVPGAAAAVVAGPALFVLVAPEIDHRRASAGRVLPLAALRMRTIRAPRARHGIACHSNGTFPMSGLPLGERQLPPMRRLQPKTSRFALFQRARIGRSEKIRKKSRERILRFERSSMWLYSVQNGIPEAPWCMELTLVETRSDAAPDSPRQQIILAAHSNPVAIPSPWPDTEDTV